MSNCEEFVIIEDDEWAPVPCPSCGGSLGRYFPTDVQFNCEKCGKTLEALPIDDVDTDMEFAGKICIVPEYAIQEAS